METVRIPLITEWSAENTDITGDYSSLAQNVVVKKRPGGNYYVTQRPSFKHYETGGNGSVGDNNRCAVYEPSSAKIYIANDEKLWSGAGAFTTQITIGTNASSISTALVDVEIDFLNGYGFLVDAFGNQGKWWDLTGSVYYDMDLAAGNGSGTFTYFPPNNSLTLKHGIAVLDRTMYVLCSNSQIWGSDLNDGSSWTSGTNFVTAERVDDIPVYITTHHDHVVYFGSRSIEFFYDAANPTGSPLSARDDIYYNIGSVSYLTIRKVGDIIFFIGNDGKGQKLYKLENFQLEVISHPIIDELLEKATQFLFSPVTYAGVTYLLINIYDNDGLNFGTETDYPYTFVYDVNNKIVTTWKCVSITDEGGQIMPRWSVFNPSTGKKYLYLSNGDYLELTDEIRDYNSGSANDYVTIAISIDLPPFDNGNSKWKFFNSLEFVGEQIDVSPSTLSIYWQDEDTSRDQGYTGSRTLDLNKFDRKIKRMGRAKRRKYRFDYNVTDEADSKFVGEAVELEFDEGAT